jgi:hypothetical protein
MLDSTNLPIGPHYLACPSRHKPRGLGFGFRVSGLEFAVWGLPVRPRPAWQWTAMTPRVASAAHRNLSTMQSGGVQQSWKNRSRCCQQQVPPFSGSGLRGEGLELGLGSRRKTQPTLMPTACKGARQTLSPLNPGPFSLKAAKPTLMPE